MKIIFLFTFFWLSICIYAQSEGMNRFGIFVAPTLGLDHHLPDSQNGEKVDFYNDHLPLLGGTIEHHLGQNTFAAKVGFEPIFVWGYKYGYSSDVLLQIKLGSGWFKVDFGIGYMNRKNSLKFENSNWKQNAVYFSLSPEFRIKEMFLLELGISSGIFKEKSLDYPVYGDYFGRVWSRLNLVYLF